MESVIQTGRGSHEQVELSHNIRALVCIESRALTCHHGRVMARELFYECLGFYKRCLQRDDGKGHHKGGKGRCRGRGSGKDVRGSGSCSVSGPGGGEASEGQEWSGR